MMESTSISGTTLSHSKVFVEIPLLVLLLGNGTYEYAGGDTVSF
jgi:hypothetical protein